MEQLLCSARHQSTHHTHQNHRNSSSRKGASSMATLQLPSFGDDSIYSESTHSPEDIFYSGSEDEYYDSPSSRTRRYEDHARRFLQGRPSVLLSASLRGPFEKASGWSNPWKGNGGRVVCDLGSSNGRKKHASVSGPGPATPVSVMKNKLEQRVLSWREDVQPSSIPADELCALSSSRRANCASQSKKRAARPDWLRRRNLKRMRPGDDVLTPSPTTTIHSTKPFLAVSLERSVSVPAQTNKKKDSGNVGASLVNNSTAASSKRKCTHAGTCDEIQQTHAPSRSQSRRRAASVPFDLQMLSPVASSSHHNSSNGELASVQPTHLPESHSAEMAMVCDGGPRNNESPLPENTAGKICELTPLDQHGDPSWLHGTTLLPSSHKASVEDNVRMGNPNPTSLPTLHENGSGAKQIRLQPPAVIKLRGESIVPESLQPGQLGTESAEVCSELSEIPDDEIDAFEGGVGVGQDSHAILEVTNAGQSMVQDEAAAAARDTADDSRVATQDQSPWMKAIADNTPLDTATITAVGVESQSPWYNKMTSPDIPALQDQSSASKKNDNVDSVGLRLSQNPWMEDVDGINVSSSTSLPQQLTSPCSPNTHVGILESPDERGGQDACLLPLQTPQLLSAGRSGPPSTPETKQSSLPTPDQTISIKSFRRFRSPTPTPPPRPRLNKRNGIRSILIQPRKRSIARESSKVDRRVRFHIPGEDGNDSQSDSGDNYDQGAVQMEDEDDYIEAGLSSRSINRLSLFRAKEKGVLSSRKQQARTASPPPQSTVLAEDLPGEVEKFQEHFAAVANRATGRNASHTTLTESNGQMRGGLSKTTNIGPLFELPGSPSVDAMASRFVEADIETAKLQRPSLRPVTEQSAHETKSQDSVSSRDKENLVGHKLGGVMETHEEEPDSVDDVMEVMDNLDDFLRMWDVDSDLAKVQAGNI